MFLASRGPHSVPPTVNTDQGLPAIEFGGVRLHAERHGKADARTIVVLHGGPGADYASLLPLRTLADTFQVVFYDQRGAGLSQRVSAGELTLDTYLRELDGVIDDAAAGRQMILIGHSWSAMLASAYLAENSGRVQMAVLMEPGS